MSSLNALWAQVPWYLQSTVITLVLCVVLILSVAYLTLWERKVIGWMQMRIGPNRVRIFGLLPGMGQPFADVIKLLIKEIVIPAKSNKILFRLAPAITLIPAFAAWAVVPIAPNYAIANIDAGLLYVLSLTSMGIYGVILAGWASNSKYAFLGAMRSAAQMLAYEIAMGFALVGVLMAAGSLNLGQIVAHQHGGPLAWNWFWLLPLLLVYFIAGVAETNRAPFDVAEGESEIVAGFHVEYSGSAFAIFFLAEYANMILVSFLASILFLGGWLSPFPVSWGFIGQSGFLWLLIKAFIFSFMFLWFRASFPRYRYDQIMRLGWKVFIPIAIVWVLVAGCLKFYGVVSIGTGG